MNRREFLKTGLCGGGLLATASLPSLAQPKEPHEMVVNHIVLPIGAERPFKILHLSDTHLKATLPSDSEETRKFLAPRFKGRDPEDALATSLAWAKSRKIDYVLHTGDLIDLASDGNVALVRKFFGSASNILYAPGNHEYASNYAAPRPPQTESAFRAINTAKLQAAVPVDLAFNAQIIHGVNFIMLDAVYGTVAPASIEKFHAEAKKGLPIVLCMHVPFFTPEIAVALAATGHSPIDEAVVPNPNRDFKRQAEDKPTADFIRYLKSERLLKAILAGHWHCGIQGRFSPTAMQYVVDANFRYRAQQVVIY